MPFLSTYRLQLHKDFRFQEAAEVVDYLSSLGISHLYLSPIFESNPGSTHGYDGLNPELISTERGGEEEFKKLIRKIQRSNLDGLILDVVPNHLSCNWRNPAWWDALEKGRRSKHWKTFDIKTSDPEQEPVVLPVLGKRREAALASRELLLCVHQGKFAFQYFDAFFPIRLLSQKKILKELSKSIKEMPSALAQIPSWIMAGKEARSPLLSQALRGIPLKFLNEILDEQFYVLKDWRRGSQEVNYRRFFDINELVGVRIEDDKVFRWYHRKIFDLLKEHPEIQGLRVDHVDGLTFPSQYLKKLRKHCPAVWVEKILGEKETLPSRWPVMGSTGYEFSNISGRLFVDVKGLLHLHSHYLKHVDDRWEQFHDCVYESKREMLDSHFSSEMKYLTELFYVISQKSKKYRGKFSRPDLHEVIAEVSASLRIYRTYAQKGEKINSPFLEEALIEAEGRGKMPNRWAYEWFRHALLAPGTWSDGLYLAIKRWEQVTGPVMAKGLEDTALYRYCPLLSLNGVGGEPDWIGDGSREYHSVQQENLRSFPFSLITTSTHDTKRSEDVKSRIHILSELSEEWIELYHQLLSELHIKEAPSPRVIYFIFETIIGAWPFDGNLTPEFLTRLQNYFVKAMREAKTETSWSDVNASYEALVKNFVHELLFPATAQGQDFLKRLQEFTKKVAYFGAFNSLGLLALKGTSPGVSDFYQGSELWDLSLVDPDNRRPVNYELRKKYLHVVKEKISSANTREEYLRSVCAHWRTGEIKLLLTHQLLQLRRSCPSLILEGRYLPVEPEGARRAHFVSYMRNYKNQWLWIVIPRFLARTPNSSDALELQDTDLLKTSFQLPTHSPSKWQNLITGEEVLGHSLSAAPLFKKFPVAIYFANAEH